MKKKMRRRRNPDYHRTIIRVVRVLKNKVRIVVVGYRDQQPFLVDKSVFGRFKLKAGDRLIGKVTLEEPVKSVDIKEVKRLPKPGKEVLAMFKKPRKKRRR